MKRILTTITLLSLLMVANAQQKMRLDGNWRFALDTERKMTPSSPLNQTIKLPGTTDEAKFGTKSTKSDFGILTREYKYYGLAWYSRTVDVPKEWEGKRMFLKFERVMWQSKLYVDGKEVGMQESLNSPHVYDLGVAKAGKREITVSIDNDLIYNIGDKGHMYTEYTQSIWNGAIGEIELYTVPETRLSNPQVYTKNNPRQITVKDNLIDETKKAKNLNLRYTLTDFKTGETVFATTVPQKGATVDFTASLPETVKLWDDVNPNLYNLNIAVLDAKNNKIDERTIEVGFREIENRGNKLFINGRPLFLRGNLDCVHFPLTGYPSCNVEDWERIFRIYKDYGLNHVRFHSWTPPAAAFKAADRLGIYMQSEVIWLDWWMAIKDEERPEMFTKGMPDGLGKNPSADKFTIAELRRMVDWYGNSPSFTMMCIGNELGNSDFEVMESFIKPYRQSDTRRLYASTTARKINPSDQYAATHYIQGLGGTRGLRGGASLDWDFEDVYSKAPVPVIAHEIGQWPVYPRWSEIKKYKGTLKAMNFEEFAANAPKIVYDMNDQFVAASGALNQIMYKYEIESFLRTPSCAGIQLLSMQDYQGQGEALIGWLDVFYDSKGITTPESFRGHHDTTVLLLRLPKFTYANSEKISAKLQLAHWGTAPLTDAIEWKITDPQSRIIAQGSVDERRYDCGTSSIAGEIEAALSSIKKSVKLTVSVALRGRDISNSWDVWVYDNSKAQMPANVYVANRFDQDVIKRLENGERVLLDASELGTEQSAEPIGFYPLYWSMTFFPGQGVNTIGMVVNDKSTAFKSFPTENHSNWQWQTLYKGAKGFCIEDFPVDYRPLAQPVDDFHRNKVLASIFELKVGKGSLLVCGFGLQDSTNVAARALKASLAQYAASADFVPEHSVSSDKLQEMFRYIAPLKNEVPKEFDGAILYIESAAAQTKEGDQKWNAALDKVKVAKGCTYSVESDGGTWKDETGTAWHGGKMQLKIECPKGFIGSLYLYFHDWNDKGREAVLDFEGRDFKLARHSKGQWVRLHVMREDSNKGFITLKVRTTKGGNTMLSKVALIAE